jgi:hypothetical protein
LHIGTLLDGILPLKNKTDKILSDQNPIFSSAANHYSPGQHKMGVVLISGCNKLVAMLSTQNQMPERTSKNKPCHPSQKCDINILWFVQIRQGSICSDIISTFLFWEKPLIKSVLSS